MAARVKNTAEPFALQDIMNPWPSFKKAEIDAVIKVLRSGKVNCWTGKEGRQFEEEYAKYVGVKHAIAVSNGSVALELALTKFLS